jgi:hypothetical protein
VFRQAIICLESWTLDEYANPGISMRRDSGLMNVLILSLEVARLTHETGKLSTENECSTDLGGNAFDLRVTCRSV